MCLSDVSDQLELTFRISFVYHDSSVKRTDNKERMFFEEDNLDDSFVLVLVVFTWVNLLQKLSALTAVFSHKTPCIPDKEFTTFIPKLSSCDVGVMVVLVEFGENLFETACNQVVDPNVVGSKEEHTVHTSTDSKVEYRVELVDLA